MLRLEKQKKRATRVRAATGAFIRSMGDPSEEALVMVELLKDAPTDQARMGIRKVLENISTGLIDNAYEQGGTKLPKLMPPHMMGHGMGVAGVAESHNRGGDAGGCVPCDASKILGTATMGAATMGADIDDEPSRASRQRSAEYEAAARTVDALLRERLEGGGGGGGVRAARRAAAVAAARRTTRGAYSPRRHRLQGGSHRSREASRREAGRAAAAAKSSTKPLLKQPPSRKYGRPLGGGGGTTAAPARRPRRGTPRRRPSAPPPQH
jgi:hypothetical protein